MSEIVKYAEYLTQQPAAIIADCDRAMKLQESRINSLEDLVRDMWHGMCGYGHDCYRCDHMRIVVDGTRMCEYRLRMVELGIEVEQ